VIYVVAIYVYVLRDGDIYGLRDGDISCAMVTLTGFQLRNTWLYRDLRLCTPMQLLIRNCLYVTAHT